MKTKVYPISDDQKSLSVLADFRKTYYQFELQKTLEKDSMTKQLLNGGKLPSKDFCPDLNITASLRMSLKTEHDGQNPLEELPLALVLTVDLFSTIRLYEVHADLTELVFAINLTDLMIQKRKIEEIDYSDVPDYEITSVDLLLKAKMVMITTLSSEIFMISDQFSTLNIKFEAPDQNTTISDSLIFEHKSTIYMVFGLSSGQFLVEQFMTCAKKGKINMD